MQQQDPAGTGTPIVPAGAFEPLRRGAAGSAVSELRALLAGLGLLNNTDAGSSHVFDEATELAVLHFQQRRSITADGTVGRETYLALVDAHWKLGDRELAHQSNRLMQGDDVTALQTQLLELGYDVARPDGVFGPVTAAGLRAFQRDYGMVADGICGPQTLRALKQLGRRVVGGSPQLLREMAVVAASGPSLLGKRVVIDPGHGASDPGTVVTEDDTVLTEAQLVWDLATRLEGRLRALGVSTWLTRGPSNDKSDDERADLANDVGADLVLSLHVDGSTSAEANGIATYYFGGVTTTSTVGERLADLVQRELVARTGLLDNRIHGKAWSMLRRTRMPAVRVEIGYLTSPIDRRRLLDPTFYDTVADGLLVAVQRLYLASADDPPTGVMQLSAVR
jgi:N-acetylmuramoyl-L-alanine amidase